MKTIQVENKKAFIFGALIILVQMAVYSALWLNPYIDAISAQFADNPAVKPYDYFGGLDNWMRLRTLYNVVFLAILIKIFLMFYSNIPGKGWIKGIYFGLIISLIKVLPEAFNKWTLIVYPDELILLQLINGSIGLVVFGVLVSTIFHKFSVIRVVP
ncbi:hypothetical protein ACFL2V_15420 [Pseudomonadota bacterium]